MDLSTHPEWPQIVANIRAHQSGQLDLALATAEDGFPVFPVNPKTKAPLIKDGGGFKTATTDVGQIIQWWNRWNDALVSIPTGEETGIAVLDVDTGGEGAFGHLMARFGLEFEDDLSRVATITPSRGRHFYFACQEGTSPRTRASDIAPNIDSRGLGGSIIIPGNMLPDGRSYRWASSGRLHDVQPMPPELLYLATFNANERRLIKDTPKLREAIKWAGPTEWAKELDAWRRAEQERVSAKLRNQPAGSEGMRAQALSDLADAAAEVAGLRDGRKTKLFSKACAVGKYVAHGVLTQTEFRCAFYDAARANESLAKYGNGQISNILRNALTASANHTLPLLAREFREGAKA